MPSPTRTACRERISIEHSPRAAYPALVQPSPRAVGPPLMAWKTRPVTGHLKGFVRRPDGRTGDGLTVEISGPVWRVLTVSGTGFYGAAGLPPGHYDITVTLFGQPLTTAVVVGARRQGDDSGPGALVENRHRRSTRVVIPGGAAGVKLRTSPTKTHVRVLAHPSSLSKGACGGSSRTHFEGSSPI